MNSIEYIDELIKEYLLFRGFFNTFKAFEGDLKTDKDKGFQVLLSPLSSPLLFLFPPLLLFPPLHLPSLHLLPSSFLPFPFLSFPSPPFPFSSPPFSFSFPSSSFSAPLPLSLPLSSQQQVEKLVEQLVSFINNYDLKGLVHYWNYLDTRFFSRLETKYYSTAKQYEDSLLKYYLVSACQHSRKDKIFEFFELLSHELAADPDWVRWFC